MYVEFFFPKYLSIKSLFASFFVSPTKTHKILGRFASNYLKATGSNQENALSLVKKNMQFSKQRWVLNTVVSEEVKILIYRFKDSSLIG